MLQAMGNGPGPFHVLVTIPVKYPRRPLPTRSRHKGSQQCREAKAESVAMGVECDGLGWAMMDMAPLDGDQ